MSDSHPLRPFQPVRVVAALFRGFPRPWFIAGGWGIDLFLGALTRPHDDVDVAIYAPDQELLQAFLVGWELSKTAIGADARVWTKWEEGERLDPPYSLIRAQRSSREPPAFEVILSDVTNDQWRYHRDPTITHPLATIGARSSIDAIPYLAPEVMLLWKAKSHRQKDEHDFYTALPHLESAQRAWLREALTAYRPTDQWLSSLS